MKNLTVLLSGAATGVAAIVAGAFVPATAAAQSVSREVVQPLPPAGLRDLQAALARLARDPRDVDALVAAGEGSLSVGDAQAAEGFYLRALEISPQNPRAKAGLAAVMVRNKNPYAALTLFNEAEKLGVNPVSLAADRGLAHDLVGDNIAAQAQYRRALSTGDDAEITRRLALSLAISGDRAGAEQALLPLLQRQDLTAYRTRAFVLAILGDPDEAITIAEALMPAGAAREIEPYLRYLPRLSAAEQAAAGHLGIFPAGALAASTRMADAGTAAQTPRAGRASAPSADPSQRLVPQGSPMGQDAAAASVPAQQETVVLGRVARVETTPIAPTPAPTPAPSATASGEAFPPGFAVAQQSSRQSDPSPTAPEQPTVVLGKVEQVSSTPILPEVTASGELPPVGTPAPASAPAPVQVASTGSLAEQQAALSGSTAPSGIDIAPSDAAPGFDLAQSTAPAPAAAGEQQPIAVDVPASAPVQDINSAFADFALPSTQQPAAGAVDLSQIDIPVEPKPAPAPATPVVPSRVWVQVATGQDKAALAFDWRRIARKAGDLLAGMEGYTASWGETNRLVTGPLDSRQAANDLVAKLKEAGIDSFRFTSEAGEAVDPLR